MRVRVRNVSWFALSSRAVVESGPAKLHRARELLVHSAAEAGQAVCEHHRGLVAKRHGELPPRTLAAIDADQRDLGGTVPVVLHRAVPEPSLAIFFAPRQRPHDL